jgi:hypothetical protein
MPEQPDPSLQAARIRRNKWAGRLIIIAMGLLAIAQVAPILQRALQGHPL